MEYQVLPILREYYIDGIIRLSNDASDNYLNKYLTGEVELSNEVNDEKEKVIDKIINTFKSLGEKMMEMQQKMKQEKNNGRINR